MAPFRISLPSPIVSFISLLTCCLTDYLCHETETFQSSESTVRNWKNRFEEILGNIRAQGIEESEAVNVALHTYKHSEVEIGRAFILKPHIQSQLLEYEQELDSVMNVEEDAGFKLVMDTYKNVRRHCIFLSPRTARSI
ncbi:hypothetical protein RCL1_003298 [Eukaryota sp. TZLM3-RCL]